MAAKATPALRPAPKRQGGAKAAALQPKLTIGSSNDRFEREADRIADRVVNGGSPAATTPPSVISAVTAQRTPAPVSAGPEQTEEKTAPPRRRRSARPDPSPPASSPYP